ncbi:MAG: delta 1-pyrroline-5-carboxylate synthetase [Methanobrevibacter sp.]|nr:delta 1-pyrroline-5-carboxylate synthetase [Methanobrevibacter sp.]
MELIDSLKGSNCLIINGGGNFANLIRKYDEKIGFSNDITHEVAIDSMDIIAKLLNDKFNFTEIVYGLDEAKKIADSNKIPILACSKILKDLDPFEHSWNITSDSIAAYISNMLEAKLLIATNVDGIYTRKPTLPKSNFIDEIDAKELLNFDETSVDLFLAELLLKFGSNCFVVNGNYPERVMSIISNNTDVYNFQYTYIRGD